MDAGTQNSSWVTWVRLYDAENAETPSDPWIHCELCSHIHQYSKELGPQSPLFYFTDMKWANFKCKI